MKRTVSRKENVGSLGDFPLIVVTILGGVAEIAENPGNLPILLLDLDEVEAGLRECEKSACDPALATQFLSLEPAAINYLKQAEPHLVAKLKPFLPTNQEGI